MPGKTSFLILLLFHLCTLHARQIVVSTTDEIINAIKLANPTDTIYIRGGLYKFSSTIKIQRSGSRAAPILLQAYPNDNKRPLFDFSAMAEGRENKGLVLSADYWHIKGLDIFKAGNNGLVIING